ncbi:MAG: metalloregulator ArsR/SmtB family transcription factor [Acidobacteriota bacterium]
MSTRVLRAIAEPRRQRILRLLRDGERTAGEIAADADVTFGAISQHLRVLKDAGLVESRREGRSQIYRARTEALGPLAAVLQSMWEDRLGLLKGLAEWEELGKRKGNARRAAGSSRTNAGGGGAARGSRRSKR